MQCLKSMNVFIHHHATSLDTDIRFRLKNGTMKQRGGLQNCRLYENKWLYEDEIYTIVKGIQWSLQIYTFPFNIFICIAFRGIDMR